MLERKLGELFSSYGYKKFTMSKFESYDLYSANRDFLKSTQLVTFTDVDGKLRALKPDITLSIIKNSTGESEKVYYIESVYRPKDGRFREIRQAGAECVGKIDIFSEAEMLSLAAHSLAEISDEYIITLSDKELLSAFFADLSLTEETGREITSLMTAKNSAAISDLCTKNGCDKEKTDIILSLCGLYLPFSGGIEKLKSIAPGKRSAGAVLHLEKVCSALSDDGAYGNIYIDLSTVNDMDYYNGIVFQGAIPSVPFSILSGGRYDGIPEKMGKNCGAIGFAIYLDEIENYTALPKNYDVDILIVYEDDADPAIVSKTAIEYRSSGKSVVCMPRGYEYQSCKEKIEIGGKTK